MQNHELPAIGPDSFSFCHSIAEIENQIENFNQIIGGRTSDFIHSKIDFAAIGDYRVKMYQHPCSYGAGLICLGLFLNDIHLAQVSFFPASPLIVFEIKGIKREENIPLKEFQSAWCRFTSETGIQPVSALVLTTFCAALRTAH